MISVVVLTHNDESMVRTCLESVKWADEIIIVDDASTDKTLEIAKKYTDKVYEKESLNFSEIRNFAFEKTKGDWVLYVDSDERILKPLRDEIEETIKTTNKSAFAIFRKNIIFGKEVSYGPYKKDSMVRLLKREDFKKWVGEVHEHAEFNGELGYLKNQMLHLTHRNVDQFVQKSLDWSKIDAKLRMDAKHPKMTKWRFIRILATEFYEQGIKRKGFFNGNVGMVDSVLQVFSLYITYVRLWQMQQEPLDDTYKKIDKKLEENGFNYQ